MTHTIQARTPSPQHPSGRDDLVRQNLGLARSLAVAYRDRGEPLEDLIQVAYLGLVRAANHYDPQRGHGFLAYAVPTMKGELRKHFRDYGWDVRPPRRLQDLRSSIRAAEEDLRQELSREPTRAELAHRLGIDENEVQEGMIASEAYHALSLDAPASGQEFTDRASDTLADLLVEQKHERPLDGVVDTSSIRPMLGMLTEREQLVVALRFFGGYTQQQIAERIGVTQMQVSRLLSQVLSRLRALAVADPNSAP